MAYAPVADNVRLGIDRLVAQEVLPEFVQGLLSTEHRSILIVAIDLVLIRPVDISLCIHRRSPFELGLREMATF